MNEEGRKILDMLAGGKISVDEAQSLIDTLSAKNRGGDDSQNAQTKPLPKYLRVEVGSSRDGNVNVKVPFQLLRAGVKIAALLPKGVQEKVNDALSEQGIDVNLNNIKPENLEELINHLSDLTIDVDSKDGKVRVYCE